MAVDVNRLRRECVYQASTPLEAVAGDLAQIETLATAWRAARKRLFLAGAISIALGVVGLAAYVPVGLMLIALGVCFFVRTRSRPRAVANGAARRELAKSVAAMLAHDAEPNSPTAIRLAFNPKRELLSEDPLPHRKNGKQRLYKASWFSIETTLCDSTVFTETIEDLIRQRSFTNPRGKSKVKTRTHTLLAMRFAYSQKVYGDATPLAARMRQEIQVPSTASVRGLEVTARIVKVKALVTQSSDLAPAGSMLALGVYRMLNLSRELQARKRAQPKAGGPQ